MNVTNMKTLRMRIKYDNADEVNSKHDKNVMNLTVIGHNNQLVNI